MKRPSFTEALLEGVEVASKSAALELAGRAFGGKVEGTGDAAVLPDLQDIRVFEEEASKLAEALRNDQSEASKLAEALRNDQSVVKARSSGQSIVVVTKSYEAIPTVTVHQRSDSKSEDWARLKGELTKAKGRVTADDAVEFRSTSPQVVAFKASEVSFLADHFSPGNVKVELQSTRTEWACIPMPRP